MCDVCICLCVGVQTHLCGRERISSPSSPMRQGLSVVHFLVCRPAEDSGGCPEATMRLAIEVPGLPVHAALSGLTWVLGMQTWAFKLTWHTYYQLNHLSKPNRLLLRAWMPSLLYRRKMGFGKKLLP